MGLPAGLAVGLGSGTAWRCASPLGPRLQMTWPPALSLGLSCSPGLAHPLFSPSHLASKTPPPLYLAADGRRPDLPGGLAGARGGLSTSVSEGKVWQGCWGGRVVWVWASVSASPCLPTERPLWEPAESRLRGSPRPSARKLPLPPCRPPRYEPRPTLLWAAPSHAPACWGVHIPPPTRTENGLVA